MDAVGFILAVVDDGKCDIRFQGHKLSIGVGESEDLIRYQEVLVFHVEAVLFEFRHAKKPVVIGSVEFSELKDQLFVVCK